MFLRWLGLPHRYLPTYLPLRVKSEFFYGGPRSHGRVTRYNPKTRALAGSANNMPCFYHERSDAPEKTGQYLAGSANNMPCFYHEVTRPKKTGPCQCSFCPSKKTALWRTFRFSSKWNLYGVFHTFSTWPFFRNRPLYRIFCKDERLHCE